MTSKTQKQRQSEQTQRQIIETAAQLFARKGFHGTSIADLAQTTGLTKGALYHHFENKDALFFAVVNTVHDAWREEVARDVLEAGDALAQLGMLFDNHTRLVNENKTLCLVLSGLVMEMEGINPAHMTALQALHAEMVNFITHIIQTGQAAGQVRTDLDTQLMALNVMGMLGWNGCSHALTRLTGTDYLAMMAVLKQMLLDSLRS